MQDVVQDAKVRMFGGVQSLTMGARKFANLAGEAVLHGADTIGVRSHVEEAQSTLNRAGHKGIRRIQDASRDMAKTLRLNKKTWDFEEDNDAMNSADYDLLMSAAGATEKFVNQGSSFSQTISVPAGSAFVWKARVKKGDIGFAIRETTDGPHKDIEVMSRYGSESQIQGQLPAGHAARNITMVFDNSHSHFEGKHIVCWAACGVNVSLTDERVGKERWLEQKAAEEGPQE